MARKKASKVPAKRAARDQEEHLVGYGRVSKREATGELQMDALLRAGVKKENIYFDYGKSGANIERDELNAALKACRPAEAGRPASTLVTWKIDRVSRNLMDLLRLSEALKERGVTFKSLTEYVDSRTAIGKLMFRQLAILAEFERDLMLERTMAGLASARARGRMGGAPRERDDPAEKKIATEYWDKSPQRSHREHVGLIAKRHKITRQTVYNIRDRHPDQRPKGVPAPRTKMAMAYER